MYPIMCMYSIPFIQNPKEQCVHVLPFPPKSKVHGLTHTHTVSLPFYKQHFTQLIGIKLEGNVQENKHAVFLSKIKNLNMNLKKEKPTSKSCYICRNTTY